MKNLDTWSQLQHKKIQVITYKYQKDQDQTLANIKLLKVCQLQSAYPTVNPLKSNFLDLLIKVFLIFLFKILIFQNRKIPTNLYFWRLLVAKMYLKMSPEVLVLIISNLKLSKVTIR